MDTIKRLLRLAIVCQMIAFAANAAWSQTTAVRANDFLNTIGVNTGICYGSDSATTDATLIKQFGIREVRDDDNDDPSCTSLFISVYQSTGARFAIVPSQSVGQSDITTYLSDMTTLANAGALLALEGPNEPYYQPVGWNGATSSNTSSPYWTPVADFQQALYSQAKSNSTLKSYPVWDVTLGGWESNDVGLQWLTIPSNPPDASTLVMPVGTEYADYANVHNYTSEACWLVYPTFPVANMMWDQESTTETLEADACVLGLYLDYGYTLTANYTLNYPGYTASQLTTLPKVSTETGFQEENSSPPFNLTDDQIGRLYLDLFLDAEKNGWSYTFLYELHDSGDGYGLVSSSYAVRTQGTYLQNFTTILADTSSNFTAGTLSYSVASEPATVHDLLLQKSNGTFYIAVWDEQVPGSGTTDTVTVNLGGTYNVSEFDPTVGTSATTTLTGVSTVSLTLSLSPILLQLSSATIPAAPVAAAATSVTSTGFTANWGASSGATGYYLDVSTSSSFSSFVSGYNNLSVGNVTSRAVTGLTASTTYYYRVRASNSAGTSGNSNTITVTTTVAIPPAPVASAATSITSTGFTANWAASSGATGYYLDVSTSSTFSSFVSGYNNLSVGNATSSTVSGLTAGTTYYYRVRASNSAGTSGNSNTITVTTTGGTAPAAPVAAAATSVTSTGFTANWAASSGATGYYLDVSTSSSFSSFVSGYNNLSVGNVTSRAVSGLTASTTYYYRVRASNSAGTSGNSNTITVNTSGTVPAAPVAAAATSITSTGFTANWAASTGATGYYLDVSTNSSFSSFVSGYNNLSVGNVTSRAVSGLTASTTYYYRVRASNSAGTSGNSNTITVTTSSSGGSLPSPWVTQDIGATGTADSASYSNGIFTISGGNGDMYGTSDNFRYVDEATSGNWTIVADVTSISDVDGWGKAGVMIRASTAANAVYAGIFVTAGDGIAFQYRTKAGGSTTAVSANDYGVYWVKMVQSGSSFSGYYSTNGTTWTQVGSTVTITAMPGSATAGMAVSSDTAGDLCTATFSNVTSN